MLVVDVLGIVVVVVDDYDDDDRWELNPLSGHTLDKSRCTPYKLGYYPHNK